MKKLLIVLMVVAMASFLFVGCNGTTPPVPVAVTGVTLDQETLALVAGGATGTLVETVAPADATDPRVIWASSDEAVATVDAGVVTPLTAGTADITVTTVDGGFTATCEVTVSAAPVAVTGVTLDEATLALTVGDAAVTLVATVAPADATDPSVTWASSDEAVAIVAAGVVTPLNAGISAITATTVDGGFVATCVVTVTAAEEPPEKTEAPFIASIPDLVDGYLNASEASGGLTVNGHAIDGSLVTLYINGEVVDTTIATKSIKNKSGYSAFLFDQIPKSELGEEGVKSLYATAKEPGFAESDPSNEYEFILDTVAPEMTGITAVVEGFDLDTPGTVTVTFNEAINGDTAEDVDDWTVTDITDVLVLINVDKAELTSDDKVVELEVTYTGTPAVEDVILVTYENFVPDTPIEDLAGNPAVEPSSEVCLLGLE